jgi:hypothetical protein
LILVAANWQCIHQSWHVGHLLALHVFYLELLISRWRSRSRIVQKRPAPTKALNTACCIQHYSTYAGLSCRSSLHAGAATSVGLLRDYDWLILHATTPMKPQKESTYYHESEAQPPKTVPALPLSIQAEASSHVYSTTGYLCCIHSRNHRYLP